MAVKKSARVQPAIKRSTRTPRLRPSDFQITIYGSARKTPSQVAEFIKRNPLPDGVTIDDLYYPDSTSKDSRVYDLDFQLWFSEGDWVIPVLEISPARRRRSSLPGVPNTGRMYAYIADDTMDDEKRLISCGNGPHIEIQLAIYVRKSRVRALQPVLKMKERGVERALKYRDRLSTRRMQTRSGRAASGFF